MPKNKAAGIEEALCFDVDADDDVVDLLEVVKPGILSAQQGAFPDPTPVDHVVDPHESLDLPGMDDLDAFLSSLGAEIGQDAPVSPDDKLPDTGHGMEDLDAVPALGAATSEKPDRMDADYLDSLLAEAEKEVSANPVTAPDSLPPEDLGLPHDRMAVSPATPRQEYEKDAPLGNALTAALDAAATAEEDFESDGQEVPFDAVRDAALDALLQAAQAVADDQPPSLCEDDEPLPAAFDISLTTAAGDIASEASDMIASGADTDDSPKKIAAQENTAEEEPEVPPGGLFPEPVMEDAPLNKPTSPDAGQDAAATGLPASSSRFDEVDLDELDALLDNVLASAPAPDRAPATLPDEVAPERADVPPATDARPSADNGDMGKKLETGLAALLLEVDGLREGLADLSTQVERLAAAEEAPPDPGIADTFQHMEEQIFALLEAKMKETFDLGLADRLKSMENQIFALETRLDEVAAREEQAPLGALDERVVQLEARLEAQHETRHETRLEAIEQRFADFTSTIDKVAAKAAAKVIREEITAMAEQDD